MYRFITICMILAFVSIILHISTTKGTIITQNGTKDYSQLSSDIKSYEDAALKPNRMYLEEMQKEDRAIAGPFGIASGSIDVRSPHHITTMKQQKQVMNLLEQSKDSESDFDAIRKSIDKTLQNVVFDSKYLTKYQKLLLKNIQDGNGIHTRNMEQGIEDQKLTYDELIKILPQVNNLTRKDYVFNHALYSINTKQSSVDKAVLSQFNT